MRRRREAQMWRRVQHDMQKAANRVDALCRSLETEGGVQPTISRTGHVTLRCDTCGKVCFRDKEAAEEAVAKIPDPMVAYRANCGFWHLATRR